MSKQIWNEGRVVGYSAYEVYLKQYLANNPDTEVPPATEMEWLASSIGSGASMLLKVPASSNGTTEDDHYKIDIPLPTSSRLGAANTIVASFFDGDGYFSDGTWANIVTDYGKLISNTSESSPDGVVTTNNISTQVPTKTLNPEKQSGDPLNRDIDADTLARLKNYMKIQEGLVIQPGNWDDAGGQHGPKKDEEPDITIPSGVPVVRLHIKGIIDGNHRPVVLLTGFTDRSVIAGVVDIDGSVNGDASNLYYNGEFLGPAVYPWANKIIFDVPKIYFDYTKIDVTEETIPNQRDADNKAKASVIVTGDHTFKCLEIAPMDSDGVFDIRGTNNILDANRGTIHWDDLLHALTNNESIDLLATALGAGDYISVVRNSNGKWIITNTKPATADVIQSILQAGNAIDISLVNGKIQITNIAPYSPAGLTYKYLYASSSQYTPIFMNDWTICTNRSMVINGAIASNPKKFITNATSARKEIMFGFNGDSLVKKSNGLYKGWMHVRLLIGPTEAMVNTFLSGSKKTLMLENRARIYFGCSWVNPKQFKHSYIDSGRLKLSGMLGLKFQNKLAQLTTANWLSSCTDDIWNVRELYRSSSTWHTKAVGASWQAHIGIYDTGTSYNKLGYPVVSAGRYADGKNNQLSDWITVSSNYGQNDRMIVTSINNRMSGSVYVNDLDYDGLLTLQANTSKNYYSTDMVAKNFNSNA